MHDILVSTRESRSWSPPVQYAARLAALLDGNLTAVYHVSPPIAIPDGASLGFATELIEISRDEAIAAASAHAPFARWAREIGARSGNWHVAEGPEPALLASAAKWSDLIVLDQPRRDSGLAAIGVSGQVILENDQPCLVVPRDIPLPRLDTILVAWKATTESVRALHAALPLLKRAKHIQLVHGENGISAEESEDSVQNALRHLQNHGLSAAIKRIDPSPLRAGAEILEAATAAAADLLVMGAYGRTRLSEWTFGGATRHILEFAHLPVFMRH